MDTRIIQTAVLLVTLLAGVVTIASALGQAMSRKKESRQKKKEWVASVCNSVRTISRAMGIGELDLILNSIRDGVLGRTWLDSNPNHSIISNDDVIDQANLEIDALLNDRMVSKNVIDSFRKKLSDIIKEYRICRNDLGVVVDLCEANSFDEVQAIVNEAGDRVSEDLLDAIDATCRRLDLFVPSDFILDVIGLRFVDSRIPDYKKQADDLANSFQEAVLTTKNGTSSGTDDRRYKIHSSSEAMFEKAERCSETGNYEKAFEWYVKASNYGLREAFYKLGECYEIGEGCPKNPEKAKENYEIAAEGGLPIAEYRLGRCYEEGYGCDPNPADAAYYYQRSADSGYPASIYRLGLVYWHGMARVADGKEAFRLIDIAAQKGCIEAQRSLSALYYLENDLNASMEWAKTAAENGDVEGMGYYAYLLMKKGSDERDFLPWLTKSAEYGSTISQFNLGLFFMGEKELGMYCGGFADKCPKTPKSTIAYQWFGKAAMSGDAASQFVTGMFELRKNTNREAAKDWFEKAVGNGFRWASFGIGLLNHQIPHYSEAREQFERSWEEGNPLCGYYLRLYRLNGLGCAVDRDLAASFKMKCDRMICNWFLSDPRNQSIDPTKWYVPPFDRQFFKDKPLVTTCDIVKDSCYMTYIRIN